MLLQIFDNARHNFRMGGSAEFRRGRHNQIRLNADPGLFVADQSRQFRFIPVKSVPYNFQIWFFVIIPVLNASYFSGL